ncbi:MAG: sulfotransferase [Alphaproteobacteria bacterium]|nr:sulfotransferase [Alphaproteobacteria bacterium]MCB9695732.1 sulfotransferase [Alphaproteobacteria bacterium]
MAEGVVVLGISRSGTTLVQRLLDAHPEIAAPPETLALTAGARFLASQRMGSGASFGVLSGLATLGVEQDEVVRRVRALCFGFLEEHAARAGKPRWACKTAVDVFHLPEIEQLCGEEVRYVGVLRHGLDVAVSLLELVTKTGAWFEELHRYQAVEPRPLVAAARAWADATEALLGLRHRRPERVHLLRYEDLVREPDATLDALTSFLGVPRPDGWAADALSRPGAGGFGDWKTWEKTALDTGSVGRWRRYDRVQISAAVEAVAGVLEAAGYDAPTPMTPEEARRRAEMAMRLTALKPGARRA